MLIEQLPASAAAAAILLSPGIQGMGRPEVIDEAAVEVAAPFHAAQSFKLFEGDVQAHILRQQYLQGSSALNTPVSFHVESDSLNENQTPEQLVFELRRLSGLTWAQIARVFGVSARAPYHWASGNAVSAENHKRLGEVVTTMRFIDRGTAEANRNLLLGNAQAGQTYLELLSDSKDELVRELAGEGVGRPQFGPSLSRDAAKFNAPRHWGHTFDASQDIDESEVLPTTQPKLRRVKARRKKA